MFHFLHIMESQFQLLHRKFIKYAINETGEDGCSTYCNSSDNSTFCQPPCWTFCPNYCHDFLQDQIHSESPATFSYDHSSKSRKILIITISIIVTTLVALLCYAIYAKFYLGWWSGSSRRSSPQRRIINETHDDFLDEDHGPVVHHPSWHIRTVGLQPSIISAITVLKYKKGDGLKGTECSVCLGEFQENETLRLLPKCSHPFHISCIDTWLRSHTNCPLCRAPIVMNTARAASSSSESIIEISGTSGNTQVEISANNEAETERELEDGVVERRNVNGTEEECESQLEQRRKRNENSREEVDGIC